MLRLEGIVAGYNKSVALDGVSIEIPQGRIVSVVGANGAGKSTIVNTISRLVTTYAGKVWLDGQDITGRKPAEVVELGIVQVPEGRKLFAPLTVEENLRLGFHRLAGRAESARRYRERLDYVLDLFPIMKQRIGQRAGTMSGGEQQMLAVGRALMTNPRLLVLDEATEGLAPVIRKDIWAAIRTLKAAGQSILVVDKTLAELLPVADRCFVLEKGMTVFEGSPEALTPERQDRYLGV
ncbi:ABC transporter ATP-binding protein [Rhizobiaceae sp. 2RAB30]